MEAAAHQAGVLSQASREVSDSSRQAAESLAELRAAIGEIATSAGRASAVAEEPSGTAGQVYTGAATVAGRPYCTAYAGLRSPTGDLIGMLYVGLPLEELSA